MAEAVCDQFVVKCLKEIDKLGIWYKLLVPGLVKISPRLGHSVIPGRDGTITIVGGGHHEGAMSDVWEVNLSSTPSKEEQEGGGGGDTVGTESVKKLSIEGLKPKYEFLCTKIEEGDTGAFKIWMFGGADAKLTFNEVGYIEDGMWVESLSDSASGNRVPSPRTQGGNSAVVEVQGKLYLCVFAGGQAGVDAVADGNLYLYDIEEQVWIIVPVQSDIPPVTQGHVLTAFGTKIFIHGGLNGSTLHKTLYMIDITCSLENQERPSSWTPVEVTETIPTGRAAHGIAKGSGESSKFYIFGGLGQSGCNNDLWEFDTLAKCWRKLSPTKSTQPSPRFGVAMCIITVKTGDESANYLVLHGGMNSEGEAFNDLWAMKLAN